jgi:hypothetical protein
MLPDNNPAVQVEQDARGSLVLLFADSWFVRRRHMTLVIAVVMSFWTAVAIASLIAPRMEDSTTRIRQVGTDKRTQAGPGDPQSPKRLDD